MPQFGQIINDIGIPVAPTTSGISVPFGELEPHEGGSPIISVQGDGGGTKTERLFKVARGDVSNFIAQAIGFAYIVGTGPSAKLRRYLPWVDPQRPWLPAVNITRVQGLNWTGAKLSLTPPPTAPTGTKQSILLYENYVVGVEFGEVDYGICDDATVDADTNNGEFLRYVTFTTDSSVDYISIPAGTDTIFKWSEGPHHDPVTPSNSGPIPDAPGRALPGETFHWRWRRVPYAYAPYQGIANGLGRVNMYPWANCDPHTLLFTAKEQELRKQVDGSWSLDLVYSVRYLRTGWNKVLDWLADPWSFYQIAAGGVFYTPGSTREGKLIFDEFDVATIFAIEA